MLRGAAKTQTENMAQIQPTTATRLGPFLVIRIVVATIIPNDIMLNNASSFTVDI